MSLENKNTDKVRKLVGLALLMLALAFAFFCIEKLLLLWNAPQQVGLVRYFTEMGSEALLIKTPEGDVELPQIIAISVGVFFCLMVLSGFLGVVRLSISSSFGLLFPDSYHGKTRAKKEDRRS